MVQTLNSKKQGLFRLGLGLDLALIFLLASGVVSRTPQSRLRRGLQDRVQLDFEPHRCDVGPCQPWTSVFGSKSRYTDRVIIECSVCITMDHSDFRLEDGIDIRGRLEVPDGTPLKMETSAIVVQGEFVIAATQPVDGAPPVVITMFGEVDERPLRCQTTQCSAK